MVFDFEVRLLVNMAIIAFPTVKGNNEKIPISKFHVLLSILLLDTNITCEGFFQTLLELLNIHRSLQIFCQL